jgi:bacillithiol biosynthesis cysteine-adding enzyme BshC
VNALEFAQWGPVGKYWLEAFVPDSPLHEVVPVGPLASMRFPSERAEIWADQGLRRASLVAALQEDLSAMPPVQRACIEKLADSRCLAVVTGQQPGLFGGPLYTFAKILTAVVYAENLEREWNRPVVPILWNGGDDHDLKEIDHLDWPGSEGPFKLDLTAFSGQPAWKLPFPAEFLEKIREFIETHHPETEFRRAALGFLAEAVEGGSSWTQVFNRIWRRVFANSPLVIVDPWKKSFRNLVREVFREEILHPELYREELETASHALQERGFDPHVHKKEGVCSFFLMEEGLRLQVRFEKDRFVLVETGLELSRERMLDRLENAPEDFSPSALLRPVVQDALLPTAASVLGPSEIAYHAQTGGIYQRHGIPRPFLLPRFSFSIVSAHQDKHRRDLGLAWTDFQRDAKELGKRVASSKDLEASLSDLEELASRLEGAEKGLTARHGETSPGLVQGIEAQFKRIRKPLEQLEDLLRRDEMKRDQVLLDRIAQLRDWIYPGEGLQERVYSLVPLWCRFGSDWLEPFMELAKGWDGCGHQIVVLGEDHD